MPNLTPVKHYWRDNSGSTSASTREIQDHAIASDMLRLPFGSSVLVTDFSHDLGDHQKLEHLGGDNIETLMERLRVVRSNISGGTDFEPIYRCAEDDAASGLDVAHVIVTDGEYELTKDRRISHPANVSYIFTELNDHNQRFIAWARKTGLMTNISYAPRAFRPDASCLSEEEAIRVTPMPTEQRLREITRAAIDRRSYDDHTRREIRGLENVIAREIFFELTKEN